MTADREHHDGLRRPAILFVMQRRCWSLAASMVGGAPTAALGHHR